MNILKIAMQANPGEVSGNAGNTIPPSLLVNTSQPPVTPALSTVPNWTEAGMVFGKTVLAAEQGIVIANENATQTKMAGLLELCKLDKEGRAQFIGGVSNAFSAADGDKLLKGHQNYMADLRRVSKCLTEGWKSIPEIEAIFAGKGKYAEKMEKIPRAKASGGQNAGTGAKAAQAAAAAAVAEHGADAVQAAVANLSSAPVTTDTAPQRHQQNAEKTTDEIISTLSVMHESQIEAAAAALAKRCALSNSPLYQELGKAILKALDAATIQSTETEQPAKMAANG
jgi:hypothetical protein